MWRLLIILLVAWLAWLGWQPSTPDDDPDPEEPVEDLRDPELVPLFEAGDWEALTSAYASRKRRRPLSPRELSGWARVQFELQDYGSALMTVEQALGAGATSDANRELKARCLLRLQQPVEAAQWLTHWRRQSPNHPEALFLSGVAALDGKAFREGLKFLHGAVKAGTQEEEKARRLLADTYMHLGLEARDGGRLQDAVVEMETALSLDPENGSFHHTLGRALLKLKRWPEALDALDHAHTHGVSGVQARTGLLDDLCTAHHELAAVALLAGELDTAIVHAQQGLQWVTTDLARERLTGLLGTASRRRAGELRLEARATTGEDALHLWRLLLRLEPTDPEALWEESRTIGDPVKRREVEQFVLASDWGVEARLRLATRAREERREREALDLLTEAWLLARGATRLRLEEELFGHLTEWGLEPAQEDWRVLWRWRSHEGNPLVWDKMIVEVERRFPERWYLWAYRADRLLERGEMAPGQALLDEIEGLDPPDRARDRLRELQARVELKP